LPGQRSPRAPIPPPIEIDPELALVLFIAPVLLDAAFDASPRDLRRHARSLASLVLIAVVLSTAAVAFIGWKVAGLPVAAAVALGAIVAPPDAVAASAVLSQLRPPRRIVAILQGESLLNDATALLIYRLAVGAASASLVVTTAAPLFILSAVLSVVVGYILARLFVAIMVRVHDAPSATILQFVSTFGVWMIADRTGLSPIVTMVAYAMASARMAPSRTAARNRVSSYSVWETAVFVLNVLAFVLMGLQVRPILARLAGDDLREALVLSGLVFATVVVVRLVWVLVYGAASRLRQRGKVDGDDDIRGDILIGWCGMRGLVTLATAFALPLDFPGRDEIMLTAFSVVLGTLVLQGMTLRPLMRLLRLKQTIRSRRRCRGRVSPSCRRRWKASTETFPSPPRSSASNMRRPAMSPAILTIRRPRPTMTSCGCAPFAASDRGWTACARTERSAMRRTIVWRRRSTGQTSTRPRPGASSRWRPELSAVARLI
jgi:CPA1 family monovalent cation:H+ antiporter